MNEEDIIMKRVDAILSEYAQLPQLEKLDITLEALPSGDVKVKIQDPIRKGDWAERVIGREEDLSFIGHTMHYPATLTPNSKMFDVSAVKNAHFDRDGYLIVTHDDSTEKFKVDSKQRKEVNSLLKAKLGNKYTPLIFKEDKEETPLTNPNFI